MKLQTILLFAAAAASAENIRVVKFSESDPFHMGEVTSRRIIHPGIGAKKTTLNLSVSQNGAEFAQHVHDYSDDTILVLNGEVNLRQGDSLHLFKTGEVAFVPTGQIHGTITAGKGDTTMISFQNPPDLILYTGARDSKKKGNAPPKGDRSASFWRHGRRHRHDIGDARCVLWSGALWPCDSPFCRRNRGTCCAGRPKMQRCRS